ncbi:hypothetical protein C2845_PM01G24710 [Panicum miliaceum]|uniref:Uncharacterized protein n=1 Tax=Panicum miliaceum TaxID=4540 RepID=A0A3L6TLP2_PANMI|nr:hypothetical protein C2845_PM01G24710 [Panicum miliaceum]
MPPTRPRCASEPTSPRRPPMRKRAAPPAALGSAGIRASRATSPHIGVDDPASTSPRHLVDAGEYPSAVYVDGPTSGRHAAIDSTARGPVPTATSCKLAKGAPPVPLGSARSRAFRATSLPIGIGDSTSTSPRRSLFHVSHSAIDGTAGGLTSTATSCKPIATSDEIAMGTGGGSGPWTNMICDENDDVDAISLSSGFQWSLDDLGTQTKVAKAVPKRAGNYTHEEDIQLCIPWENISTDPIIGNEQPGRAYWKRIADHYHANKTFE